MAWNLCGVLTQNWNKITKQGEMKCKKQKLFSFSFSNRNLKATKEQILFIFYFQKQWYAMQSRTKKLIYMHIKQTCVFFNFSFINAKEN